MRQASSSTTSSIGARIPARPRLAVTELEPSDGIGQPHGAHRAGRRTIRCQHGSTDVERLPAEGCSQRAPRVDRRKVAADDLDLAAEGRIGPGRIGGWAADATKDLESIQRQRPLRRRRWRGSGSAVRREECPERPDHADRRLLADTRPSRRIGGGRTSDERHDRRFGAGRQRGLIGRSTLCIRHGRSGARADVDRWVPRAVAAGRRSANSHELAEVAPGDPSG